VQSSRKDTEARNTHLRWGLRRNQLFLGWLKRTGQRFRVKRLAGRRSNADLTGIKEMDGTAASVLDSADVSNSGTPLATSHTNDITLPVMFSKEPIMNDLA
jgi:hypothetical protein